MVPARQLLWLDCIAGGSVGLAVLLLLPWLAALYALPVSVLGFTGVANLAYAAFSFSLARRPAPRSLALLHLLIAANALWPLVCIGLLLSFWDRASQFGHMHLLGEALFVGALAFAEWRNRLLLTQAA